MPHLLHFTIGDSMNGRKDNRVSGDLLLELLNSVNDVENRKKCQRYANLYRIITMEGDESVLNAAGSFPANEEELRDDDPFLLLEIGELLLYRGDMQGYRKAVRTLDGISLRTLFSTEDDPLFIRNRLAILEAMGQDFPESLKWTIELAKKFPHGAEETNDALRNLACTLVECIHICGFEHMILPQLSAILKRISKKGLRDEATALVARKLCMRDENTPATKHELVDFARNELLPSLDDRVERDFTEIQIAVAEMRHSQLATGDKREEFRARSESAFSELEKRLTQRLSEKQRVLLNFNLIRGLAQAGLYERSRVIRNRLVRDFEEDLTSTMDTLEMMEVTRKRSNGYLPRELREMERQLVESSEGRFTVSCGGLILAARFSPDDKLASEYFGEAGRMLNTIPFQYVRFQLLLQLGNSLSFRHDRSGADRAFKSAADITRTIARKDGVLLFEGELTDEVGESYSLDPRQSILDLYTDLAADLRIGRRDLDRCIVNLMASIYSHARAQRWKIAFNE